jgi:hypothetical protein
MQSDIKIPPQPFRVKPYMTVFDLEKAIESHACICQNYPENSRIFKAYNDRLQMLIRYKKYLIEKGFVK